MTGESLPPHDTEAEEQLLGAILTAGAELLERVLAEGVTAHSFWFESNRAVFGAAVDIAKRGEVVDTLMVKRELERTELIAVAGGGPRVQSLPSVVSALASWPARVRLLLEAERRRQMRDVGQRILDASGNGGLADEEAAELARKLTAGSGGARLRGVDHLDVASLLASPPPPIQWAWQGYIEAGQL